MRGQPWIERKIRQVKSDISAKSRNSVGVSELLTPPPLCL